MTRKKKRNRFIETRWNRLEDQWENWDDGVLESTWSTKVAAIEHGRGIARLAHREHVIKNKNGRIAARNSYGNDPPRRPG